MENGGVSLDVALEGMRAGIKAMEYSEDINTASDTLYKVMSNTGYTLEEAVEKAYTGKLLLYVIEDILDLRGKK